MTRNELYRKTLERLQVVADGEPSQPSDVQSVTKCYAEVFEILELKNLADWSSEQDIPPDAATAMTMVMAAHCAEDFGLPEPRKTTIKTEGLLDLPNPSLAERMLLKRSAGAYISTPAQPEYF